MFSNFIAVLCVCGLAVANNYKGYKVYEIVPKSTSDTDFLHEISLQVGYDGFHISRLLDRSAEMMVAPSEQKVFESNLLRRGMQYNVIVEDVSKKLRMDTSMRRSRRNAGYHYYRFNEINDYLEEKARKHPNYVTVLEVGESYEGRIIKAIRITNGRGISNNTAIFVDAGIHAREWLAPATALNIINQLVENRSANQNLLKYDWIILPVVNPDGYEYTHTSDRLWRKTRSVEKHTSCFGVDGNRNFATHWHEIDSSNDSCSYNYEGSTPFSEPETRIVRDIMLSLNGTGKLYLSFHAAAKCILYPWGWTSEHPANRNELEEVAKAGVSAIRAATGSVWKHGSPPDVIYSAAGISSDYAYEKAGFPISIIMELQPSVKALRKWTLRFDPRPEEVDDFLKESWIGIKAMAEKVIAKYK